MSSTDDSNHQDQMSTTSSDKSQADTALQVQMQALRDENSQLREQVKQLMKKIEDLVEALAVRHTDTTVKPPTEQLETKVPPTPQTKQPQNSVSTKRPASRDEQEEPKRKQTQRQRTPQRDDQSAASTSTTKQVTTNSETNKTTESSLQVRPEKQEKIPPIILHNQARFNAVSKKIEEKRIMVTKSRLIAGQVQMQPATIEDHRHLTRFLSDAKEEYHTYALPSEKQLRVVMRGIPDGFTPEDIKQDLTEQGFQVHEVARMTCRRTNRAMPLLLIKLPLDQEEILKVTRCNSLVVRVEKQRETTRITQCHKCQKFGHTQTRCSAEPKCMKCAKTHLTKDCNRKTEDPKKCANCGGAHPASYRGCPRQPKIAAKNARPVTHNQGRPNQQQRSTPPKPATRVTPGKSFADAARRTTTTKQTEDCPQTLEWAMKRMEAMQETFEALNKYFAMQTKYHKK